MEFQYNRSLVAANAIQKERLDIQTERLGMQSERIASMKREFELREAAQEDRRLRIVAEAKTTAEREVVSYLCHEIRNPFNAVKSFGIWIRDTVLLLDNASGTTAAPADTGKLREWCNSQMQACEFIVRLLNSILDLSKLEDTVSLSYEAISVGELVEGVYTKLGSLCPEGVDLRWDVHPGLVIRSSHLRMEQVLVAFVSNAMQHTKEGTIKTEIRWQPDQQQLGQGQEQQLEECPGVLHVSVTDSGSGIPAEVRPLLFKRFGTAGSRKHGCGLGLTIAQRIVQVNW